MDMEINNMRSATVEDLEEVQWSVMAVKINVKTGVTVQESSRVPGVVAYGE